MLAVEDNQSTVGPVNDHEHADELGVVGAHLLKDRLSEFSLVGRINL